MRFRWPLEVRAAVLAADFHSRLAQLATQRPQEVPLRLWLVLAATEAALCSNQEQGYLAQAVTCTCLLVLGLSPVAVYRLLRVLDTERCISRVGLRVSTLMLAGQWHSSVARCLLEGKRAVLSNCAAVLLVLTDRAVL